MIVQTRTPLRITLGGGGTDLPGYYRRFGGSVLSATIDKFIDIRVEAPTVAEHIILDFAQREQANNLEEIKDPLTRETLRAFDLSSRVAVRSISEVSSGTGLGSSGSYVVGLVNALSRLRGKVLGPKALAEEAYRLEAEVLKRPVGKQDQYLAAYGGFRLLEIAKSGIVKASPVKITAEICQALEEKLLMFYSGVRRDASVILQEQGRGAVQDRQEVLDNMHAIKAIGEVIFKKILDGDLDEMGRLFDRHWLHKKKISPHMSSSGLDDIYHFAKEHGALGGKIIGAGGGGYFVFYLPSGQSEFQRQMATRGLMPFPFRFCDLGSRELKEESLASDR